MKSIFLYPRLAAIGIKKNGRTYIPYILASAGMIMIFYIVSFLSMSEFVSEMPGGYFMSFMLSLGCGIMVVFSAIFLFYTNSFLIKRRKTEFGLYNILGMGKGNIARILIWETIFIYIVAEILGIGCGVLFSKLAELFLANLLGGETTYVFKVELFSISHSLIFYAVIFLVILLNGLRQIRLSNPIELLHSQNSGERPPKSNVLTALVGAIMLIVAYYMAVTIENPLSAIFMFFVAVILVIGATYLLFIAGSVVICRILQKNKRYYYKTNHFVSISQMAYRMKRNGAGLASICILATMVLVTFSSTVCLYIGEDDMLRQRYPKDVNIRCFTDDGEFTSVIYGKADEILEKYGETPKELVNYSYLGMSAALKENTFIIDQDKVNLSAADMDTNIYELFFITIDDYNRIMGRNVILNDDEAILYKTRGGYDPDSITIDGYKTFKVKEITDKFIGNGESTASVFPSIYIFVNDRAVLTDIFEMQKAENGNNTVGSIHEYYGFDLNCKNEKKALIGSEILTEMREIMNSNPDFWKGATLDNKAAERDEFFALYGGLFFLGIMLGSVFICAAVLIMYYKQMSEGYEDKSKYVILKKVGMTKKEIRQSINSQVLTVFFLPLIASGIHMIFAFPMVSKMLMLFGLSNISLFAFVCLGSFGVFAALYIIVYLLTSGSYYRIVN